MTTATPWKNAFGYVHDLDLPKDKDSQPPLTECQLCHQAQRQDQTSLHTSAERGIYLHPPPPSLIKPPEPHAGDISTFLLCLTNSSTFPPPHTRRVPLTASMAELSILCGQVLFQNNCAGRDQSHRGSTGMDSYCQSVTLHAGAYPQTYMSTGTQCIIPHFLLPEPVGKLP